APCRPAAQAARAERGRARILRDRSTRKALTLFRPCPCSQEGMTGEHSPREKWEKKAHATASRRGPHALDAAVGCRAGGLGLLPRPDLAAHPRPHCRDGPRAG